MTRRHTEPDEIDPAAWAERDTDAGTRDPFADRGSVDDVPYDDDRDDDDRTLRRLRVWIRSAPGMWATYDGYVDVVATLGDAFRVAVRRLAATSFPDRPSPGSWLHVKTETL